MPTVLDEKTCSFEDVDSQVEFERVKNLDLPKHVAIIMDGNRRWAKRSGLPVESGHWEGAKVLDSIVRVSSRLGIETVTAYAFSTENWGRPSDEVRGLMDLFRLYLIQQTPKMVDEGVRFSTIGDLERLPEDLKLQIQKTGDATKECSKIDLVVAVNYGSRNEITRALKKILIDVEEEKLKKGEISEDLISEYLDTSCFSDPDLLIRTGGVKRLSNFLLWQLSYSEVYTTDEHWPDFSEKSYYKALMCYEKRERRYGK